MLYNRVNWSKIRSKNPHDVFNHRIRAATSCGTINHFASKLGNFFGLQSLPVEAAPLLEALRPDEKRVLNVLRMEHIAYTMLAVMRAKELREARKAEKKSAEEAEKQKGQGQINFMEGK